MPNGGHERAEATGQHAAKTRKKLDKHMFLLSKLGKEKRRASTDLSKLTQGVMKDVEALKKGGSIGKPIKTYSSGGYIEGE